MSRSLTVRAVPILAVTLTCLPCLAADPALAAMGALAQSDTTPQAAARAPGRASTSLGNGWHLVADAGGVFVPDINVKSISSTATSLGLSNTSIDTDFGVRFDVGIGYDITPNFSIELASGMIWNGVDRVTGTVTDTTGGILGADLALQGGTGDIYNVPIMVNGQFRLPLSKDVHLNIGAGIGAVWSDASVNNIVSPSVPGVQASLNDSDWAFGYQGSIGLQWVLTANLSLGVGYAFLGMTELDYGRPSFNDPLIVVENDIRTKGTYTSSILGTLRWNF